MTLCNSAPAVAHAVALDVESGVGALDSKLDSTFLVSRLSCYTYIHLKCSKILQKSYGFHELLFGLQLTPLSHLVPQST